MKASTLPSFARSTGSNAISVVLSALVATQFFHSALAQQVDDEWPCIQQLVDEVSPVVMWPLPVDDIESGAWRKNASIRSLAEHLGDIQQYGDKDRGDVELFADGLTSLSDEQRELQLNLLALGILDVTNRVRRDYISGIKRYTRQQIAIADQIGNTLNELSVLEDAQDVDAEKKEEILATLRWHERVYDQREQAIQSLCEQPVELEEVLSDVLRDVAQYLP